MICSCKSENSEETDKLSGGINFQESNMQMFAEIARYSTFCL